MAMEEPDVKSEAGRIFIYGMNARTTAIVILTCVAGLYFISWAQAILLPLVVAILISYALDPFVSGLEKFRIPRPLGAMLVLAVMVTTIAAASICIGKPWRSWKKRRWPLISSSEVKPDRSRKNRALWKRPRMSPRKSRRVPGTRRPGLQNSQG